MYDHEVADERTEKGSLSLLIIKACTKLEGFFITGLHACSYLD
jgi:hypothetical protein